MARLDDLTLAVNTVESNMNALQTLADAKQSASALLVQSLQAQVTALQAQIESQRKGGGGPPTYEEIEARVDALRKIRRKGKKCNIARAVGYTCAEAKEAGYELLEAKAAGWSSDELRTAGYITGKGMSSREFFDKYQAGCNNFAGLDFSGEDFSRMVLDRPCSFSGCTLDDSTFDHATLKEVDFGNAKMARVDLNHAQLIRCTFAGSNLREARWQQATISGGVGATPMKTLGFSCAEIKGLGMVEGLKEAGFTCEEAKAAGFNPKECMQAGFTWQEGKAAGYGLSHWSDQANQREWEAGRYDHGGERGSAGLRAAHARRRRGRVHVHQTLRRSRRGAACRRTRGLGLYNGMWEHWCDVSGVRTAWRAGRLSPRQRTPPKRACVRGSV